MSGLRTLRSPKLYRYWHSSESQYTSDEIKRFVNKYGQNILIGGDPGYGSDFDNVMREVDHYGAYKHVYLVGPGMMDWSAEEREEIKNNAKSVGINTSSGKWQTEWYKEGGWEKKVQEWFVEYDKEGFYSAEIDNLDGVWEQDPEENLQFLIRHQDFTDKNNLNIKLMIKNLSEDQLNRIILAVEEQKLRLDIFASFGMFEKGSGDPESQIELCKKLEITAVTPINGLKPTTTYGTSRDGIAAIV